MGDDSSMSVSFVSKEPLGGASPAPGAASAAAAEAAAADAVASVDEVTQVNRVGGSLFVWGNGTDGQAGTGKQCSIFSPTVVPGLAEKAVVHVALGPYHTAAVTDEGELYTIGDGEFGRLGNGSEEDSMYPHKVDMAWYEEPERVVAVSCSEDCTFAITDDGEVFVCGGNEDGALGLDESDTAVIQTIPRPIESLHGIPIRSIAAGWRHCIAIADDGAAYGWGRNARGQLGLGHRREAVSAPIKLSFRLQSAACGREYTLFVIDRSGTAVVASCGDGADGRLGHGDCKSHVEPLEIEFFANLVEQVSSVACGAAHSLAVTKSGAVYAWGRGEHGRLGVGSISVSLAIPHRVALDTPVATVSCGEAHSVALTRDGRVFAWGAGWAGELGAGRVVDHENLHHIAVAKKEIARNARREKRQRMAEAKNADDVLENAKKAMYDLENKSLLEQAESAQPYQRSDAHEPVEVVDVRREDLWGTRVVQVAAGGHTSCLLRGSAVSLLKLADAESFDIQKKALRTLAYLTQQSSSHHTVLNVGGIDVLVRRCSSSNADVQALAGRALSNMAHFEEVTSAIASHSGISPILQLLSSPLPVVRISGGYLLSRMAELPDFRTNVVEAGYLPAIVGFLTSNYDDLRITGLEVISCMLLDPKISQHIIVSRLFVDILVALRMIMMSPDPLVRELSCGLIAGLCLDGDMSRRIVHEGLISLFLSMAVSKESHAQYSAACVLAEICADEESRGALIEAGGLQFLAWMLYNGSPEVRAVVCDAVTALARPSEKYGGASFKDELLAMSRVRERVLLLSRFGDSETRDRALRASRALDIDERFPDVHTWTQGDVAQWLSFLGCAAYIPIFEALRVNGSAILDLTNKSLLDDFAVHSTRDRNAIMTSVDEFKRNLGLVVDKKKKKTGTKSRNEATRRFALAVLTDRRPERFQSLADEMRAAAAEEAALNPADPGAAMQAQPLRERQALGEEDVGDSASRGKKERGITDRLTAEFPTDPTLRLLWHFQDAVRRSGTYTSSLFVLVPQSSDQAKAFGNPKKWNRRTFRLYALCEHRDWHVAEGDSGFCLDMDDVHAFIERIAPALIVIMELVDRKVFDSLVHADPDRKPWHKKKSSPEISASNAWNAWQSLAKALKLREHIALPDVSTPEASRFAASVTGEALGYLDIYLSSAHGVRPKSNVLDQCAALNRVSVDAKTIRWLCEEHMAPFIVDDDEDSYLGISDDEQEKAGQGSDDEREADMKLQQLRQAAAAPREKKKKTKCRVLLAAGAEASAVWIRGTLYTFGWSEGGRLGRGGSSEPAVVDALAGVPVRALALRCSCLCVVGQGTVVTFGFGYHGTLERRTRKVYPPNR